MFQGCWDSQYLKHTPVSQPVSPVPGWPQTHDLVENDFEFFSFPFFLFMHGLYVCIRLCGGNTCALACGGLKFIS